MLLRSFLTAAAVLAGSMGAVQAATVTYIDRLPTPGTVTSADATTGIVKEGLTQSVTGQHLSPWANTAFEGIGTYSSVQRKASATYKTSESMTFIWGTPDTYNKLAFYLGDTLVDSITGASIASQEQFGYAAAFVSVASASLFDKVVLSSGNNAFEYAVDVVPAPPAPVPLPAAGLLLLGSLGGMTALGRRRKS